MKKTMLVLSLLATTATTSAHASPITLTGDEIDAAMIRTVDSGYGLGRINGYGLDSPFVVQDGNSDEKQYSSLFKLNVDGGGFSVKFLYSAGWQEGVVLRLSDLDFAPTGSFLSSLAIDTNLVGYTLSVGPDSIDIGLGETHFTNNTYFDGTFNVSSPESVSAVPEPASISLIALGLVGVIAMRKRSRYTNKSMCNSYQFDNN
ncbi:PEP-CTERM sorting domain-containing protein [Geobacter hydrogenophilus]|uniref:Ice-binding protein C-terminal domain-containing protein n=1 Tax=Geobacter hydrogenophilus TaxID=40983 RepID=A0A9W6LAT8_9BACT|nr:PEP-CTERM sorting domain-containing protein [Geobacter hydrogenophilus]MBT0893805.1 PEP-CTERM sorting domain-containing protein [Geobacter hydrogenophilus]GLI37497.1 hypothetical protein GHYDROH2_09980 [Geobacter hydrogenophilus]